MEGDVAELRVQKGAENDRSCCLAFPRSRRTPDGLQSPRERLFPGVPLPLPVDDGEIAAIQTVVSSGFRAEPWPYLEVGQKIRIESDALSGLEGILINFKGSHRVVLSVSLLQRSVAMEIDLSWVTPVNDAKRAPSKALRERSATVPVLG